MPANVFTVEDFEAFRRELLLEIESLLQKKPSSPQWLRSNEVCRLLRISQGTLHNLRRKGALPCRKMGRIVFYNSDDILPMISEQPDTNAKSSRS